MTIGETDSTESFVPFFPNAKWLMIQKNLFSSLPLRISVFQVSKFRLLQSNRLFSVFIFGRRDGRSLFVW